MKSCSSHSLFAPCIWLSTLLFSNALSASTQQFQASWEKSSWKVESGPGQCTLTHTIPHFGRARFEQVSGRRLQFSLHVDQPPVKDHKARLHSEAPAWNHAADRRELGSFNLKHGKTPLSVPRDQAMRILYELEQGMQPVLEFTDWGDGQDQVRVALLPVRFREALPEFRECTASLLYLDFEPLSEKTVYFSLNSDRLSRAARRTLEQIARDYRKRKNFRIVLGGHADSRGKPDYNMDLSRRRAAMAARFLRSRGIADKAIESRYFGESQPQAEALGEADLARNRRVTIWLAD
jgi:outer membrane protein OmpA-like peptidoglycan-associated protein